MKRKLIIILIACTCLLSSCFDTSVEPTDIEIVTLTDLTEEKVLELSSIIPETFVTLEETITSTTSSGRPNNSETTTEEYTDILGSGVIYSQDDNYNCLAVLCLNYDPTTSYTSTSTSVTSELSVYIGDSEDAIDATLVEYEDSYYIANISFKYEEEITPVDLSYSGDYAKGESIISIQNAYSSESSTPGVERFNTINVGVISYDSITTFEHTIDVYDNLGCAVYNLNGDFLGLSYNRIISTDDIAVYGINYAYKPEFLNVCLEDGTAGAMIGITAASTTWEVNGEYMNVVYVTDFVQTTPNQSYNAQQYLQVGDLIYSVQGYDTNYATKVKEVLSLVSYGDTINVKVYRSVEGEYVELSFDITLNNVTSLSYSINSEYTII